MSNLFGANPLAIQWLAFRKIAVLSLAVLSLALSACVTTVTGGSPEADPRKALETHVQLGLGYLRQNNRDSARFHFNKALDIDSRSAPALGGMALLYQMDGEMELAEEHFKKAIRADRHFSRVRNNYGSFLFQQGKYEEAFDQFEAAAKDTNYDQRSGALVNLGRAAEKLGRPERAKAAFEHALSLSPNSTLALIELADISFKNGDFSAAKAYLDKYASLTAHTARSLWLGIRIERKFGNRDKEASYALALKNMHGYSKEYLEYRQSLAENQSGTR